MIALSGCQCGPPDLTPDADVEVPPRPPKKDGGVVVIPPDIVPERWPETFASEPCPPEAFGLDPDGGTLSGMVGAADGGLRFGICIALRTLTADAFLDGVVE